MQKFVACFVRFSNQISLANQEAGKNGQHVEGRARELTAPAYLAAKRIELEEVEEKQKIADEKRVALEAKQVHVCHVGTGASRCPKRYVARKSLEAHYEKDHPGRALPAPPPPTEKEIEDQKAKEDRITQRKRKRDDAAAKIAARANRKNAELARVKLTAVKSKRKKATTKPARKQKSTRLVTDGVQLPDPHAAQIGKRVRHASKKVRER